MNSKISCECYLQGELQSQNKNCKTLESEPYPIQSSIENSTTINSPSRHRKNRLLPVSLQHIPSNNLFQKNIPDISKEKVKVAISENDKPSDRQNFLSLKWAAIVLQRAFRTKRLKDAAAVKKFWEDYLLLDLDRMTSASHTIQRAWRWRRKWRAAIKIQSWFRGCANRQLNKVELPKHIEQNSTSVLLLIVGGFDPNKPKTETVGSQFSSHQIWKNNFIQENRWELVGHMIKALRYPGYALRDDLIYVTGGFDGSVKMVSSECQVLNIKECTWTRGPSLNISRNQHASCSAGQFVVVFGGISHDNRLLDTIEVLDSDGLCWVLRKSRLSHPRAAMAIAHSFGYSGHIIWLCGGVEMLGRQLVSVNEIECYDFDNDHLLNPRAFAAAVVCERVVYVVGGVDGGKHMEDIEGFRLESLRTFKAGSLKYLRRGLKAVEYDGCVLVVGGKGMDDSHELKQIEIMTKHEKNVQIADLPKPLLGFGCFIYQPVGHLSQ